MSFFDRIGKAFDALPDVGEARSGIGTAWQWANEERDPNSWLQKPANAISAGTSWFTQPIKSGAGEVGEALSTAYSYGIARPVSTGTQMAVTGGIFAPDAWNQAWNRSEEISPGQAIATATGGAIAAIPDGRDPRPEFMQADDPFSKENAKEREKWFHHTWSGRLASGSIDLFLNFGADPTAAIGKGLKAVGKANTVVKASERATLLEGGVKGAGGTGAEAKKIRRTGDLITRIQQTPLHELPAMPELRDNADAGAMAILFQRAKELYPDENVPARASGRERVVSLEKRYQPAPGGNHEQRQAIADILGTAWGDEASMDRLVSRRTELATEMERISSAPPQAKANIEYSFEDNGQGVLDLFDRQAQRVIGQRQNEIQDELDRLIKVITPGGQQSVNRIGAGLIERAQQRRAVNSINESWVNTGLAGQPARFVAGTVGTRIPDHINIKDASAGYDDMVNVLGLMDNTEAGVKQDLVQRFLKSNTQNERMNVVDMTRRQIVLDAARKYGLNEKAAKELIAKGDGRMESIRSTLKQRLYSAVDDQDYVTLADPDEDIMNIFHKPLLRTQLEEMHPIIDPREMDKALKVATGSRMIDHLGSTDVAVGNAIGSMADLAAEGLLIATKRWKDTALMRFAYPLRIQTDSQLRQMVHMETMQYMATRWTGVKGAGKYLMTDKDNPESFTLKNFFKGGDYEQSLREMLLRDVGDERFNIDADDVEEIVRNIASRDGGMADLASEVNNRILSKRRTGDWTVTQPNDAEWVDKYIRVVNRQIRNSPTAMAALANDDMQYLIGLTRTNAAVRAEYRETGVHYENVETWLQKVIGTNNHYLPDPTLRRQILGKQHRERAEFAKTGETLFHGTSNKFDSFMDQGDIVNRRGRVVNPEHVKLYFTESPNIAEDFQSLGYQHLDIDRMIRGDVTKPENQDKLKSVISELQDRASSKGHRIQRVDDSFSKWNDIDPASITMDDLLDDRLRIQKPDADPRVIKTKVYGKTLDLRKWDKIPDDVRKALFNNSESQWRRWGRNYEHETDRKLLPFAREGGYGKIRVEDSHESGGESVIAIPEYIGHNRDVVKEMMGDPADDLRGALNDIAVKKLFGGKEPKIQPMPVHGEGFSVIEQGKIQAKYNKIREGFYNLAAEMPETVLARAPLFWDAYRKRIAASLENLSEDQIESLTIDTIRKNAMRGARKDVGKVLYDASHSSNLSSTMRFLSPFFSAWEDTMSKWSTLMYDNPQIPVRILKLTESPNDAGVVTDSEGNRVDAGGRVFDHEGNRITDPEYRGRDQYVMLPKVFGKVFPGSGPVKVRKDSINSVFQGEPWWLPGFGPLVAVPTNSIVLKAFPEHVDDPILKYILPYGTTTDSPLTQLLPKWAKAAQNSFGTSQDFANQEGIFLAEATIDARNGGPAVDMDKIHRKTKNFFILKAFTDNASPVSIVPDSKYQLYIDKAHQYASDKTRTDWKKDFFEDFPGYAEMAISLSANETGIAATTDAYKGIQKYRKDIQADPENGWFFLGPANHAAQFNGGVYDWQMTNEAGRGKNFRGRKDPAVAIEQLQVERGWNTWNSFESQVDLELERRGLISTRQKGAEDLQWAKEQAQKQLEDYNPAWADARRQVELGKADALIKTGIEFMERHPSERNRPDMAALQQWINFRIEVKQALDLRPNKSLAYNPDLQSALEWGASQLKRNNYGFETMYNRVLQYDNLQGMDPADAPQPAQP